MAWRGIPVIGVRDVAQALQYFCEQLGFQRLGAHTPGTEMVYAIVAREGATVHLQIRRGDFGARVRQNHEIDAFLMMDDVDALHGEYLAAGVPMLRPVQDEPYGIRDFTIDTPMGARLTFGAELP